MTKCFMAVFSGPGRQSLIQAEPPGDLDLSNVLIFARKKPMFSRGSALLLERAFRGDPRLFTVAASPPEESGHTKTAL